MYSKQEAAALKKAFWTVFGQYMKPVPSAEGEMINWINYKTGEKHIGFRMDATNHRAIVAIEITHPNAEIRQLYFEQFEALKSLMVHAIGEEWEWEPTGTTETGQTICRIYHCIDDVNVFNKKDWPTIISFFKSNIMALDECWSQVKYAFEALR